MSTKSICDMTDQKETSEDFRPAPLWVDRGSWKHQPIRTGDRARSSP